jgi:hypothetical protein
MSTPSIAKSRNLKTAASKKRSVKSSATARRKVTSAAARRRCAGEWFDVSVTAPSLVE